MGITLKEIEKNSFLRQPSVFPVFWLPPNAAAHYVVSASLATLNVALPLSLTLAAARNVGSAANVSINVTTGATFDSNFRFVVEVVGFDENRDPQTELIEIVGTGGATQIVSGLLLFSWVTSMRVISTVGNYAAHAASFSVGIGNGTTNFGLGSLRVPHPIPGLPIPVVGVNSPLLFCLDAGQLNIIPNGASPDGRILIFSGASSGYTASLNVRSASISLPFGGGTIGQ